MDKEVANPFKILSAYFITAAITRPPSACRNLKGYFKKQTYIKILFKTMLLLNEALSFCPVNLIPL